MNYTKSKSRFEIWIKLQRKIKSVSCRIEEATSESTKLRLIKKLKMLVKRLFTLNRKWRLGIATATLFMWLGNYNINAQQVFDHTNMNGINGFKIVNSSPNGLLGYDISDAGDVNGDGFQDMIVSSCDINNAGNLGGAYVIFGTDERFTSLIDVSTLKGSDGFYISDTIKNNRTGISVSAAGDFNGDGFDDLIIGESLHNYNSGRVYLLFGNDQNFDEVKLNNLNGTNGFQINADSTLGPYDRLLYYFGESVSGVGDINKDGYDDVAFSWAFQLEYGFVDILYGTDRSFNPVNHIDSLNNTNQLTIIEAPFAVAYHALGGDPGNDAISHGDLNGDGFEDVVIGHASMKGDDGVVYAVFGSDQKLSDTLHLKNLDGDSGFKLAGYEYYGYLGVTIEVADINGDGFDDILAGKYVTGDNYYNAKSTVLFGKGTAFDAIVESSSFSGSDGFEITGLNMDKDYCNVSVGSIDDINGDGIDDILIGVDDIMVNSNDDAGQIHVVFGNDDPWPVNFDISTLNDTSGFIINGTAVNERIGTNVAGIGDINGDGLGDFAFAGSKGKEAFVVFGSLPIEQVKFENLDADEGITVHVNSLGTTLMGTGDFNGDSNDDLLIHDWRNFAHYIVFGAGIPESAIINTDELDGSDGFKATTVEDIYDGDVVDINQDGFDDLVFGMPDSRPQRGGDVFVLFGKDGAQDAVVDIDNLVDGESMVLYSDGSEIEYPGTIVFNGGDINGDGFDDLYTASYYDTGIGSVIFSDENILDSLKLKIDVDPNMGFSISFPEEQFHKGDINGDGKSDIILKHSSVYWSVIFGQEAGVIETLINPRNLNGTNGFEIEVWAGTSLFEELQGISDFNNDGYDDMLFLKSRSGSNEWGRDSLFLIYGHDAPFTHYDLDGGEADLNGSNGMIIKSLENGERINSSTLLDMNHDGWDDVVFSLTPSNEIYVVYGYNASERLLDIANLQASQGYKIQGFGNNELTVEKGGDLNADGFNDLIILDKTTIEATERVLAHIVYGQDTQEEVYDISDLQNNGGYDLLFADDVNTVNINDDMTDFNGDGFEDVVFSAFKTTWSDYKILLSDRDLCATETIEDINICTGENFTFPDGTIESNITANISHESILTSINGCDSTITTNITLYEVYATSEDISICSGEDYTYHDGIIESNITANISHESILTSINGCDSTITTNITLYEVYATIEDISICLGEDYTYPDGTTESSIIANMSHESKLTSVYGCDSTITTNITLNLIDVTVSVEENTLSVIELDADLYQWIDCDLETAIEGETNSSFTATETGNYAVIIENNACKNVSACNSIEITGIDDKEGLVQSIWPNPTTGKITIQLVENDSPLELSIFDITGKLLLQKEVARNVTNVTTDLNGESGVYFIKLKSNLKTATYKVIKK
jgi:hypothetical protein